MPTYIYSAKFPFVYNDVFLIAEVRHGKQFLRVKHEKKSTSLSCIHVVVYETTIENLKNLDKESFLIKTIKTRSSEKLKEINLEPEEKFKALRSWVAGIAEAGMDGLRIQIDIEEVAKIQNTISTFLIRSLAEFKHEFFGEYLLYLERVCRYEGSLHKPSLYANLIPIIRNSSKEDITLMISTFGDIMFEIKDSNALQKIACCEYATEFESYHQLFHEEDANVRIGIARNEAAIKFEEFKELFKDSSVGVLLNLIINNTKARKFEEFKLLFYNPYEIVQEALAKNHYTARFNEYKILFRSNKYMVRREIAKNISAAHNHKTSFKKLFSDKSPMVRRALARNPYSINFEEFELLMHDSSKIVKGYALAMYRLFKKNQTNKKTNIKKR